VLRGEPTGTPTQFRADTVATAKRDLRPGEMLDGEGGYLAWGKAIPSTISLAHGALPIGLAAGIRLKHPVARNEVIRFADVELDLDADVVALRREMERQFAPAS
jgi:predicted homoserine dehydrogenase-like protein